MYPQNSLGYAENFLHMTFAVPCEEYKVNPVLARAMDRIFILHADHEQNASTATVRNAGSTGANPFACIAAGIASLWGPAHGGANEAVLKMLARDRRQERHPGVHQPRQGQERPRDPVRLRPSRLQELRSRAPMCCATAATRCSTSSASRTSRCSIWRWSSRRSRSNDDYFISRKLYPNVDFYSGIILKAMGFPTSMFTVLFAIARTVGWIAQWTEMIEDPDTKIGRPRQLFTGSAERHYVPARTAGLIFRGRAARPQAARPKLTRGPDRVPLSGIRVIDLTRILAGPFCTMLLADMGADVVKVETPGVGDPLRTQGAIRDGLSWYFAGFNRNKRSLSLNLRSDEGKAVLARLIAGSDVLVENYRPGVLEAMGFGEARLRGTQARPRLRQYQRLRHDRPVSRPARPSILSRRR